MRISNQLKASLTLSKYSLLATLRSPTSMVFAILFPIVFIVVFGSMVGGGAPTMKLGIAPECDTTSIVFRALEKIPSIILTNGQSYPELSSELQKGRLAGILKIVADKGNSSTLPQSRVLLIGNETETWNFTVLRMLIGESIYQINQSTAHQNGAIASLDIVRTPGRSYKQIDFILPGQLGFSLLMSGVFGSSFLLFSLRQSLVLKRLRATPIRRRSILAGEMLSRLFFHVIGFIIMVGLGYFAFGFTLVNGVGTFVEMLLFSVLGLGVFMGVGFIISGVVQNESSISPVANTITLPQILLCGLFFPIENYPHWMQSFCNLLPLTFFVDGLRKIAFEGAHVWQLHQQVIGLLLWAIVIDALAVRAFKWE